MDTIPSTFLVILFLGINSSSDILRRQKRNWIIESFEIEEEYNGPFPYVLDQIELENKFTVMKLTGQGVDKDPKGILQIDDKGVISVFGKVDYEQYQRLSLQFEAYDKKKNAIDTQLSVELRILDINDHAPTFTTSYYEVNLKESATQGTHVIVVIAKDGDSPKTNNGTFDLRIVSVTPEHSDVEFYMNQNGQYGNISFRGCLDYEKAKTYTILVEAKDRGEKVQLSSTCTVVVNVEDRNNHLPIFTGQTPTATLKEREVDVAVLRLQAADRDTKGTDAWKAKYTIYGEKGDSFRIDTNPETNEGVLYVTKPLDYEDQSVLNLNVSVENTEKYFSCQVVSKTVSRNGLWNVVETTGRSLSTCIVTVNLEDINDPPLFTPEKKIVWVYEDVALGYILETLTAIDRDVSHGNKIVYAKGEDPGDWVTVDSKTGVITTAKTLDRESSFVKDDIYTVTVIGVDDGKPPTTGTGTLLIHVKDRNDNVPKLVTNKLDMCISDVDGQTSQVNLTAFDLDNAPFAGPFRFELHGDVANKWRIDPQYGYSVNLIREDTVYAGHHELLQLEVFDQQDHSALHDLTVNVCQCEASKRGGVPSCRRAASSVRAGATFSIAFIAVLLLGILLLVLLLSCNREIKFMPDEGTEQYLIPSNTEHPGSDCKVALKTLHQEKEEREVIKAQYQQGSSHKVTDETDNGITRTKTDTWGSDPFSVHTKTSNWETHNSFTSINSSNWGTHNGLTSRNTSNWGTHNGLTSRNTANWGTDNAFTGTNSAYYAAWDGTDYLANHKFLLNFLDTKIKSLQVPGEELGDYAPHLYADEGDADGSPLLDPIPMLEIPFDSDMLLYLGSKFNQLASLCSPDTSS